MARRQGRLKEQAITVLTPSPKDLKAVKAYDLEAIRAEFPALSQKVHGKPLVYLDNGASAQKPKLVLDTIQRAYAEEYANVHRGLHYLSNLSTANFEKARETVRRFINARSDAQIIFTRNATEAINLVPWYFLKERQGAVLKWAPISDDGELLLDEFEALLTPRTKMVAITHMSN